MPPFCINFPILNLLSHPFHSIRKSENLPLNYTRVTRILSSPTPSLLLDRNCRLNCLSDPTTAIFPPKNLVSTMDKTQNLEIGSVADDKYSKELEVAVKAVHMACLLCERHSKDDNFLVTIADWSVQAIVSWVLSEAFGSESVTILAEEDKQEISKAEEATGILESVTKAVNESLADAPRFGLTGPAEALCGEEIMETINTCKLAAGANNASRFWALGSLRGDQYAVALSLIEDGAPVVGVLGCPNYPLKKEWLSYQYGYQRILSRLTSAAASEPRDKGCVMYARRGDGNAWMQPLLPGGKMFNWPNSSKQIKPSSIESPVMATFCHTVEKAKSSHSFTAGLNSSLGHRNQQLRVYSSMKYAAIARGDAEAFMKFGRAGKKEKVWDHAAGVVIIQEAGGVVSDAGGDPLDFSNGAYIEGVDRGIIACAGPKLHENIIRAVDESWCSSCL
ncbi:PREDICTED: PAP-specific phosphatase HAL2-like [Ipomoea nil]|uniref:PAP-specific phosphatase HAL2-like n=1 Tax=Ipomoea nil TaxID=35883 RepID=UPI000900D39F|nr:PREDICTED: PAP-specific phosphatase HAL2-like [Ipomoea nil]